LILAAVLEEHSIQEWHIVSNIKNLPPIDARRLESNLLQQDTLDSQQQHLEEQI
jgi:hypothetical protein